MQSRFRNSIVLLGVILGLASLPMTWLSYFHAANNQWHKGDQAVVDITGLNGTFDLNGFVVPAWVMILLCALSGVSQVMGDSQHFYVPKAVQLLSALLLPLAMLVVLSMGTNSGLSLGLGAIFAAICACTPLLALIATFDPDDLTSAPDANQSATG